MKFITIVFVLCTYLALVTGQNFLFGRFPSRPIDYNTIDAPAGLDDPRQNRGPVVFPPSPPDAVDESSGVIVGASGYGFVPPRQRPSYFTTTALRSPSATSYTEFNYYNVPHFQHLRFF